MRRLTDVGNPDCTFSNPMYVQEGEEGEHQTEVEDYPFASLGASDSHEQTGGLRNRIKSTEARFGGSDDDEG